MTKSPLGGRRTGSWEVGDSETELTRIRSFCPRSPRTLRQRAVAVITLVVLATSAMSGCAPGAGADQPIGYGWWHTKGTSILDQNGHRVRIAAATWFGMDSVYWVPAGLDFQPYTKIMDLTKRLGYNAIRLPFSNQLVEQNPIVTQHITANPQLLGKHALEVLDDICNYAKKIGLKMILDDHRSAAVSYSQRSLLTEPLWYTAAYPETSWIKDWVFLARRYANNSAVIGFDLRNEPHTDGPGPWSVNTYLNQGATWGPYQGLDNPDSDWRLAAERCGNAV